MRLLEATIVVVVIVVFDVVVDIVVVIVVAVILIVFADHIIHRSITAHLMLLGVVVGLGAMQSHFHVKPNYSCSCVEVELGL